MASTTTNKLEQIEYLMFLVGEANFRCGFPNFNVKYRKRHKLFNPLFVNTFLLVYVIKSIISVFINDDTYSVLLGDFSYKIEITKQWNLLLLIASLYTICLIIANKWILKSRPKSRLSLLVGSDKHREKYSRLNKIIELAQKFICYSIFIFIFLIGLSFSFLSFTFIQFLLIGIAWSISFAIFAIILAGIVLGNIVYLLSFCYYSILSLKSINEILMNMVKNNKKIIKNSDIMNLLQDIDYIYSKINIFNMLWSMPLFFTMVTLASITAIGNYAAFMVSFNSVYAQFARLLIQLIIIFVIFLGIIAPIIVFCSCVVLEAKNTYKLLNRLNVKNRVLISLRFRFKVNII